MQAVRFDTFLEFVNLDLKAAPQAELMKAAMFISSASTPPELSFRFGLKFMAPKLEELLQDEGTMLKQAQVRLKSILTAIEQWSSNQSLSQEEKSPDNYGNFFHSLFELNTTVTANLLAQIEHNAVEPAEPIFQPALLPQSIPMRLAFTCHDLLSGIVFNFCRALEGTDVGSVKTCPVCKKWFLQQTRKSKLYCSNSCAAKKGNRKRYEGKSEAKAVKNVSEDIIRGMKVHKE